MQTILCNKLPTDVEEHHGLSARQFSFGKAIDAIRMVTSLRTAIEGSGVTLNIKNAFNSVQWDRIMYKLEELGVPYYLELTGHNGPPISGAQNIDGMD